MRSQSAYILLSAMFLMLGCSPESLKDENGVYIRKGDRQVKKDFREPPLQMKSRPLWFWNDTLSREQTLKVMCASRENGYAGLGILPSHGMTPAYMSPEFLVQYKYALEIADSLQMKMCLYDEFYFPSGMAGGQLADLFPEAISKRLDMEEFTLKGPGTFSHPLPPGKFMGAVAMEENLYERIDLSGNITGELLSGHLPRGDWKIMIYTLNPDPSSGRKHVDYLSPSSVNKFIELTYEKFYLAFPEHFGTTIDFAFYDEPTLRWVEGGRAWTGSFNEEFEKAYGFSPVILYPALWYDIGPESKAARNMLFGFRAELYASGFPKVINDWCHEHNIQLTGHVDQEEILNPVSICGDLIKSFKYQDIPCVDQIAHYGRGSGIYKVISSAALNYNRPLVATECYGAIRNMPVENLYKEAMDQFAKGINLMEPHAVWYGDRIDIQPNLSPSDTLYGPHLNAYNDYIGRLQIMLQGGQHRSDIAILYPIASLQSSYYFGSGDPGLGGVIPSEADYLDIGEMLSLEIRSDFAFIHPETLDEKCSVNHGEINLDYNTIPSPYKILILPGCKTIKWSNLKKIKTFYDQGGIVIASSVLPEYASETGMDSEVRLTIKEMFGDSAYAAPGLARITASSIWNSGGFLASYAIDGQEGTSWRPSSGNPAGEWLEIDFGRSIFPARVEVKGEESREHSFLKGWAVVDKDQSFAFRVELHDGREWVEAGKWEKSGRDKSIDLEAFSTSKMKISILSGQTNGLSIPEILIFDQNDKPIPVSEKSFSLKSNAKGGKAYFIPVPQSETLRGILNEAQPVWDIRIPPVRALANGNLSCLHKTQDGKEIYFFANSSDTRISTPVLIRGDLNLETWDPHTGKIAECRTTRETVNGLPLTRVLLSLDPVKSIFFVSDKLAN